MRLFQNGRRVRLMTVAAILTVAVSVAAGSAALASAIYAFETLPEIR